MLIGGSLWLDYLDVISVKKTFAPLYKVMGKTPQTSLPATQSRPLVANLDEDRLAKIQESLLLQAETLDKREADIVVKETQLEQTAHKNEFTHSLGKSSLFMMQKTLRNTRIAQKLLGFSPKKCLKLLFESQGTEAPGFYSIHILLIFILIDSRNLRSIAVQH